MSDVCPCCGQTLPLGAAPVKLTRKQYAIYDLVRRRGRHGVPVDELFERVWDDPGGGPDSGTKVLHVHVHYLNARLAPHGQRVCASSLGSRSSYVLLET